MTKNILLVIPFYNGDRGQVERLGRWLQALHKEKKISPELLFVGTVQTDLKGIGNEFKSLFDKVGGIRQQFGPNLEPGQPSWPKAPNFQFLHTAKYIDENRLDIDGFYYFEPDNLPITPDWFDRIVAEYTEKGQPFYGAEASYLERSGTEAWENGSHMIGTGIYPRNAWTRIKAYAEIERTEPNRPWDAITRDEVNPQCFFTKLICHLHNSRGFRMDHDAAIDPLWKHEPTVLTVVSRTNTDPEVHRRAVEINPEAVVIHGCKDSSLRLLYGEKLGIKNTQPLTFAHAGDLGDLVYALPPIMEKRGTVLKLSPRGYARESFTPERQAVVKSFIESQGISVEPHDEMYVDFDFRQFRVLHKQHSNLLEDQAQWVGSKASRLQGSPWLSFPDIQSTGHIVINRTSRYQNPKFPWGTVLRKYNASLRFIGTLEEYKDFEKEFGSVSYVSTPTLLDAAKYIAASRLFIGNQSACFAIAEGLKIPRIQETCPEAMDCIFDSSGIYGKVIEKDFPDFDQPSSTPDSESTLTKEEFNTMLIEALKDPKIRELLVEPIRPQAKPPTSKKDRISKYMERNRNAHADD